MSSTTFTNFTTPAVDAAWLNDTNRLVYQLAGDGTNAPANASDARNNLGVTAAIAAAVTASPGRLIGVQVFTANGTYTPTSGTASIIVEMQAGGGAGGGTAATGASSVAIGGGGGGGGYGKHRMTSGFSGAVVVVGAGGTGVNGANGNNGGNSSFAGVTVSGGIGGSVGASAATSSAGGGAGGAAASCNIINLVGGTGDTGVATFSAGYVFGTRGGNSFLGQAATNTICGLSNQGNGQGAASYGAGGGGGASGQSLGATTGGSGSVGIVIVYEYS